jgi:uncharacterized membrane protein YhiD involved in acid resistance
MTELLSELQFDLQLQNLISNNISASTVILRFIVCTALSIGIAFIYSKMNLEGKSDYILTQSLIFLSLTVAGAMMIIGNNLARAFGLVGAVSIIRFRRAVKSHLDMSYVFLAIVVGMACGLGFLVVALIITVFVGCIMIILWKTRFGQGGGAVSDYVLTISYEGNQSLRKQLEDKFSSTVTSWKFIGFKIGKQTSRLTYSVNVKDYTRLEQLIDEIRQDYKEKNIAISVLTTQ